MCSCSNSVLHPTRPLTSFLPRVPAPSPHHQWTSPRATTSITMHGTWASSSQHAIPRDETQLQTCKSPCVVKSQLPCIPVSTLERLGDQTPSSTSRASLTSSYPHLPRSSPLARLGQACSSHEHSTRAAPRLHSAVTPCSHAEQQHSSPIAAPTSSSCAPVQLRTSGSASYTADKPSRTPAHLHEGLFIHFFGNHARPPHLYAYRVSSPSTCPISSISFPGWFST